VEISFPIIRCLWYSASTFCKLVLLLLPNPSPIYSSTDETSDSRSYYYSLTYLYSYSTALRSATLFVGSLRHCQVRMAQDAPGPDWRYVTQKASIAVSQTVVVSSFVYHGVRPSSYSRCMAQSSKTLTEDSPILYSEIRGTSWLPK
jgi:hypothetical protein